MPETTIIRSKRKTLVLHVQPNATLLVKAPLHAPMRVIEQFIKDHADWIFKQTEKIKQHPQILKKQYKESEEFLYLGKAYKLKIGNYKTIQAKDNFFYFPKFLEFRIQKEISNWYIDQAKEVITRRLQANAKLMNVGYMGVYFSDTISKWGSCSHDNILQFNWRLIMAPLLVLNYVVVHELAHTIHKNHSARFWTKVASINPSHKQQIKWLKAHGYMLTTHI